MKIIKKFVLIAIGALLLSACSRKKTVEIISSPDGKITVSVEEKGGEIFYNAIYQSDTILRGSKLGIEFGETNKWKLQNTSETILVNDFYELVHGKAASSNYEANQRKFEFKDDKQQVLTIIFQLSNDGVAFRYEGVTPTPLTISNELTEFNFPDDTKAWIQPMSKAKTGWESSNPSYEEAYFQGVSLTTPSPTKSGWVFPALFELKNCNVLISETNLGDEYCASRLDNSNGIFTIDFPQKEEVMASGAALNPEIEGTWESPWRFMVIGSLKTVVGSNLGTDLAAPQMEMTTDWIAPGISAWSWVLYKDDSTVYPVQKRFVDYAKSMNWNYCLVDADWDRKIGYEKAEELVKYADSQNIGIILWYNSAGDWNTTPYTPRDKMMDGETRREEFAKLHKMGVKGLKIDFFGGDGQSMINYYHDILRDAAEYKLMINFHGATLPRGWHRTYPHLMTMESIKGQEFITFDQNVADLQPEHCATIPFTRNVFDPMDFTPMCFGEIPNIQRRTRNGFELALPTLFYSGIQHMAENPEGMATVPDYVKSYLQEFPRKWDETVLLDGYPGKYVVMARRSGHIWYIGGINGENTDKSIELDLTQLTLSSGKFIGDGDGSRDFSIRNLAQDELSKLKVELKPYGGFVVRGE
ncbi:glycoside hydrolase family 97 catalytic domain-containing protein [Flammeovirgaceae bacterium SG7u.111]|nr:glycoside hydrolase family 97 catalytic domain-containing protein [Flammeovirgaceae bacterium SG7u.132]WPO37680.1 glycoside hydrolase family 97 catalytic domain-containing protein [Flammeovirgaceae bacterium SG7u.111]